MKTVFDDLVQDLILAGVATSLAADLCNSGLGPMETEVALAIFYFQYLSAHYWFMQIFLTFLVRYNCIFHPVVTNAIFDRDIINATRIICSCWAIGACCYETLNHDFTMNGYVQFMIHGNDLISTSFLNSFKFIILLDFLFIAFAMVRIELYKWQKINFESMSKSTFRILFSLFIFICILVTLRLFLPFPIQYSALLFHVIVTFLIFVVIPVLFICRSKNIINFVHIRKNSVAPLLEQVSVVSQRK